MEIIIPTWTNVIGLDVLNSGATLKKTASNGWTNAGAFSQDKIVFGIEGYVEFTANEFSNRMMGFSYVDTDQNFTSLDYAIYPNINRAVEIYELGQRKLSAGIYSPGSTFKIKVLFDNTVEYYHNDVKIYTSLVLATGDLHIDCSFHTLDSMLDEIQISFGILLFNEMKFNSQLTKVITKGSQLTKVITKGSQLTKEMKFDSQLYKTYK